jgi:hypothetical protein
MNQIEQINLIMQKDDSIDIRISNDDYVIISSWDDMEKIEEIIGSKIDDIFTNWTFNDEYTTCDKCNNAVELNPYSGRDYYVLDNEIVCGACIRNDEDLTNELIDILVNNPKVANNILTSKILENIGFVKCHCKDNDECSFDNGLHVGMHDDPKQILSNAIKSNPNKDYIFDINTIDMFNVNFTIWSCLKVTDE